MHSRHIRRRNSGPTRVQINLPASGIQVQRLSQNEAPSLHPQAPSSILSQLHPQNAPATYSQPQPPNSPAAYSEHQLQNGPAAYSQHQTQNGPVTSKSESEVQKQYGNSQDLKLAIEADEALKIAEENFLQHSRLLPARHPDEAPASNENSTNSANGTAPLSEEHKASLASLDSLKQSIENSKYLESTHESKPVDAETDLSVTLTQALPLLEKISQEIHDKQNDEEEKSQSRNGKKMFNFHFPGQ